MTVSLRYDQYKDAWDTGVLVEVHWENVLQFVNYLFLDSRGIIKLKHFTADRSRRQN